MTYTGTHQGEFVGIPATGKQTTTNGVDFFRMQDGKQAEHWGWAGHVPASWCSWALCLAKPRQGQAPA